VRAPHFASSRLIQKLVDQKRIWIHKKQEMIRRHSEKLKAREFVPGEEFLYLGQNYKLEITENAGERLFFDQSFYLSKNGLASARELLREWYLQKAGEILSARVKHFADVRKISYRRLGLSNARKRWGSCSPKRNLRLNWRLVMAPMEVIDYVAVHELAHLIEPNHSPRFWGAVKEMLPGYALSRKWLRENGHLLSF
jgi:hypothetical protein